MNLLLRIIAGAMAACGTLAAWRYVGENGEAALAWTLFAALAMIAFLFEHTLCQRRADVAQAAEAVMAQREAVGEIAGDLVEAAALVAGAAQKASAIAEALA